MTTPGMVIVAGGSGAIGAAISRKLVGVGQEFELTDSLAYHPLLGITSDTATAHALRSYADLRNATASVQAATFALRVQKGGRALPNPNVDTVTNALDERLENLVEKSTA